MTHELLTGFMILDAAIAIGLVWLLREATKTERDGMTATFYGMPCRLECAICTALKSLKSLRKNIRSYENTWTLLSLAVGYEEKTTLHILPMRL